MILGQDINYKMSSKLKENFIRIHNDLIETSMEESLCMKIYRCLNLSIYGSLYTGLFARLINDTRRVETYE